MSGVDTGTDFGSMLLGAFAQFKISLDGMATQLDKATRQPPIPALVRINQSGVFPSSGNLSLDCGGPSNGSVWELMMLFVGGATPTTTAAGKAFVAISPTSPCDSLGNFLQGSSGLVFDQATTLPLPAQYSRGQITIRFPDHLWVVFSSGTATQNYYLVGQALDYTEGAYSAKFLL